MDVILLKQHARELRNNPSDAESHLWRHLGNSQMNDRKFRRQEVFGQYIVDFVCFELKLIIDLDGGQHNEQTEYDEQRTKDLAALGYKVLRF